MHGFADESYHQPSQTYIVGAVLVAANQLSAVRKAAITVLQPGRSWKEKPFHWLKEGHIRKLNLLADTVTAFDLCAYSVTADNVRPEDTEAARIACLEILLMDAVSKGAVGLTLDSRNASQVQRDRQTMVDFRHRKITPKTFGHAFEYPGTEPAIWIADALAGTTYAELSCDRRYSSALGSQLVRLP